VPIEPLRTLALLVFAAVLEPAILPVSGPDMNDHAVKLSREPAQNLHNFEMMTITYL
jgi:hypothetical protein